MSSQVHNLKRRHARVRQHLGLTAAQYRDEETLVAVLERELKLWGKPFPQMADFLPTESFTAFKAALVVGHRKDRDGVYAPSPLATGEWSFNAEIMENVADRFRDHPLIDVRVFYREKQPSGRYSHEIDEVYGRVDDFIGENRGISAEGHFNDLRTKKSPVHGVGGKETIYSGSSKGKAVARIFHDANPLKIKNRGLKVRSKRDRGGRSVHAGKAPGILLEPFDARNPKNNQRAFELGVDGFALAIESAIIKCSQSPLI